jgi:hypothetical protein
MRAKIAQQGKQMRVGARQGFAYNSINLVSLATVTVMRLNPVCIFMSGKALYPFKVMPCANSDLFQQPIASVVCDHDTEDTTD